MEKYRRKPNTKCSVCGKPTYKRPCEIQRSKGLLFCSQKCYGQSLRKESPCLICKTPILAGMNKKTCSRKCANVHRIGIRYKIGRPKDVVASQKSLKQRLLRERGNKCERCDYSEYSILQMHHKDRNRENNVLSNLELVCPNCHYVEHFLNGM